MSESGPGKGGGGKRPEEETEDYGGPKGYPIDPGLAYESEPEPPEEAFSEPEHWLRPRR